ncbi:acetylornithine deacetylase [Chromobacterium sp. ATCC 53434]|uniref:acetylornithine deacetylase n=1 Tax=Chromobacterium sp. (strain ATCC 53434 / SC 14030) TaxID=2059672 RepID=UPI000C7775B5|nr:acetylornithine deacetylase [Chromobacterium sp. ATCC 53434]AUH51141.1 acetylornithine deacetylase [Chromobacterium sp. ATCC 53434]
MPNDARSLLAELIRFDTTSRYSNLQLIEWVQAYLAGFGIASRLTYNDDGGKANLFARIGAPGQPLIVLSGHTDVVPVDGQDWSKPPFELSDGDDGRLYGRGSADMKGFIACVLARVPLFVALAADGKLAQGIGIALSYDEEVGCLGVGRLIDALLTDGEDIAGCLVGEPTSMRPVIAHKGIAHYRCKVKGRAAHSSLTPQGVNAIEYAARLITHIRKLADAEAAFGHRQSLYDVPFTTMQTGLVHGGIACNIVPADCEFMFECRWLPGDDPQRLVSSVSDYAANLLLEMREVAPEADIVIEPAVYSPAFESDPASAIRQYVASLCGCDGGSGVAYTTEAGLFSQAGMPCVVLGPGSIEQAHRPDEYIEASQLQACYDWLGALANKLIK